MVARFIRFSSKNRYLLELSFNKFKWLNMTKKEGRKTPKVWLKAAEQCMQLTGTAQEVTPVKLVQTKHDQDVTKTPKVSSPAKWMNKKLCHSQVDRMGGWVVLPVAANPTLQPLGTSHNLHIHYSALKGNQRFELRGFFGESLWGLYVTADIVEEKVSEVELTDFPNCSYMASRFRKGILNGYTIEVCCAI